MAEKRVTYLIGAGASANALPVVNWTKKLEIAQKYATKYFQSDGAFKSRRR